ncbi:MAG TPA: c-type cytochrome [Candidatus Acidoferrales bacterium]|nr:c-type cytochrome [Candidatus Acidoferrales bacterium]
MKGFIFGIVTMIIILGLVLLFVFMGFVNMRADNPPSKMETAFAGHAMDASVARAAPKLTNPVTADEASLVAGARIYRDHCALCHGDPAHPKSPLADSLNPPAPQFATDMADMPENQNFYILQHGIRWTGMPGWKNVLSEQQVWQTVTFLSHMQKLPPAAKQVFTGTIPQTQPLPGPH